MLGNIKIRLKKIYTLSHTFLCIETASSLLYAKQQRKTGMLSKICQLISILNFKVKTPCCELSLLVFYDKILFPCLFPAFLFFLFLPQFQAVGLHSIAKYFLFCVYFFYRLPYLAIVTKGFQKNNLSLTMPHRGCKMEQTRSPSAPQNWIFNAIFLL